MISPAVALFFCGDVLNKKREKNTQGFFFSSSFILFITSVSFPSSDSWPLPTPALPHVCPLRRDEWTSFPKFTHLSVTGILTGGAGRAHPGSLIVSFTRVFFLFAHEAAEAEEEEEERSGRKEGKREES